MTMTRGLLMARFVRAAILMACFLYAGSAFAAGGACPSGSNYLNSLGSLATLASLGVTNCYYLSAAGSDSNSGTDEAHPWAHAPQMPNCSGNCATVQNAKLQPGTGLIFRGGDTWHFGNSGASPYTGGVWNFNTGQAPNGTSANPIYIGVDQSWFSGGSWTRPIFTADNPTEAALTGCGPTSSGSTCTNLFVASCPYQIAVGNNTFMDFSGRAYYIFDNFEMTGLCASAPNNTGGDGYLRYNGMNGPIGFYNLYMHGWTHIQFANLTNPLDCPLSTDYCESIRVFGGSTLSGPGDTVQKVVVDGADSDPRGLSALCYCGWYVVANSVFRYTGDALPRTAHVFHDNLLDFWYSNGHSNVYEENGEFTPAMIHAWYNNVWRNWPGEGIDTSSIGLLPGPLTGVTYNFFNNVEYNNGQSEYIGIGAFLHPVTATLNFFNNTVQTPATQSIYRNENQQTITFNVINDHSIDDQSTIFNAPATVSAYTTPLHQTNAQATATGYTNSQTPYAYAPTSSSSPTVGRGTNHIDYCNAMTASSDPLIQAAGTACKSDTTYAVTYNASTHTAGGPARVPISRPSGAWDIGAYQFSSTQAFSPPPPTSLTAAVQ
jgi:hypothetical protein